ncbi:unnamed protein product [Cuscuta epithymum]|uniref:FRIGIDA-like protein n=1 Tax=Cuscuta epithymum TaxID=186058 RepID=A0AAV0C283_9ASTE|nr:unnamed protein product [Cuscuta epithymum]
MVTMQQNMGEFQQTMIQFQHETKSSIKNLETQVSQISNVVSRLEAKDSGKLPSQTEQNPRQHVNAIMLRSGTTLKEVEKKDQGIEEVDHEEEAKFEEESTKANPPPLSSYEAVAPFPEALRETKKPRKDAYIYETFTNCEVYPNDDEFRNAAIEAGEVVWKEGLVKKAGLGDGASGNAYAFLSLYRLTGKSIYKERAMVFANFLYESIDRDTVGDVAATLP